MRVVFDSNVWLAAAAAPPGYCRKLLGAARSKCVMVSSDPLLDEIEEKLVIKFKRPVSIAAKARRIVRRLTWQQAVSLFEKAVCRDPDDDWILATAVAGECEYLVTGDKDLLALGRFNNVRILRPAEFGALIGFLSR